MGNLEDQGRQMIGTKLKLKCDKHSTITEIQWPVDFTEVEEGGCKKPCGDVLSCGHKVRSKKTWGGCLILIYFFKQCTLKCHPYGHSDYSCKLLCEKQLDCKHKCIRRCCEPCGSCITRISVRLKCGHTMQDECGKIRRLVLSPGGQTCPVCRAPLA